MRNAMTEHAGAKCGASSKIDAHEDDVMGDAFCHGTVWPIPEIALAALTDMGLSDARIARYFCVETETVRSLRIHYGVRTGRW